MAALIEKTKRLTSADLIARLRRRYAAPEYAFMEQVRNGVGFGANRTADAVAMGVWPSRGLLLTGFEIKVSRNDWLREKKNPEKAEDVVRYMDYWYVVVADPTIVKLDELPPTWGLIVARGVGLTVTKEAPRLTAEAIDRSFLGSLLRNMVGDAWVASQVNEKTAAMYEDFERRIAEARKTAQDRADPESKKLRMRIEAFEALSGLRIDDYDGENIAAAVKLLRDAGLDSWKWRLTNAASAFRDLATKADQALAEYHGAAK